MARNANLHDPYSTVLLYCMVNFLAEKAIFLMQSAIGTVFKVLKGRAIMGIFVTKLSIVNVQIQTHN